MQTRQPAEARKVYQALLDKYPQAQPAFRAQVMGAVAQTYMAENQAPQAIEQLKKATEADPSNVDLQLAYGEILMQANQRAEGEKVLLSVDFTKVKDPFPYMNIIIGKINDQKADEALELIAKLMTQFPTENALYYYRGRAQPGGEKDAGGEGRPREVRRRRPSHRARVARREEDPRADEGHQVRAALWALLLAFTLTACGGDDGGSSPSPSPPGQDPCAGQRLEAFEAQAPADGSAPPPSAARSIRPPRLRVLESLWIHEQAAERRRSISTLGPVAATSTDVGDIAVLRDEGDLIVPANNFDLKGLGLRFTRNSQGGYDVRQADAAFRTAIGNRITLTDDDSLRADVSFSFPFYSGTSGPPSSTPTAMSRFARATARARTAASAAC
jgi:tetratricopeptide (TPR) repeat protein